MVEQRNVTLVVGATGNVGREVVSRLADAGQPVRAFVRDPRSADFPEGVAVVQGDLTRPESLEPAMTGVESVFLVWPFLPTEDADPIVDVIRSHARKVVYLSSAGVDDDKEDQGDPINQFHKHLERLIADSGVEWTFLRCTSFAASLLEWADQVREGVVREAFGEATRTLIHERDIADVAFKALADDAYMGRKLMLSGTAPLSQIEQVRIIGEALGRPVDFEEIPQDTVREHMRAEGWEDQDIDGMFAAYTNMSTMSQPVWKTVEEVTGKPARTFHQWVVDHAKDFE